MAEDDIEGCWRAAGSATGRRSPGSTPLPGETLRRGPAYFRQPQRRRGSRAGGLRQDLAWRRPLPGRPGQRPGLARLHRPQPGDRRAARAARRRRATSPRCSTSPTRGRRPRRARWAPTTGGGSRAASGRCRATGRRRSGRLCRGLELRGAGPALRRAAQHHADLAAPGADQPQGVPRVMTDATDLPDLPDDPDAALAGEYVLRLLAPEEAAACAAREARDPAFAALVAAWRRGSRAARRRLCRGGAAGGSRAADHRAPLRRAARRPSPGSGASVGLWRAVRRRRSLAAAWLAGPRAAATRAGRGAGAAGLGARHPGRQRRGAPRGARAEASSSASTAPAARPRRGGRCELWVVEGATRPSRSACCRRGRSPGSRCRGTSPRGSDPAPSSPSPSRTRAARRPAPRPARRWRRAPSATCDTAPAR